MLEIDELKLIYQEVVNGNSYCDKGFFVKHLCEIEQIEITRKRFEFIQGYVKQGIPTEKDRLERLKADDEWSDAKEGDILAYRQTISDNEKSLHDVIVQQQEGIKKIIEEHRRSLLQLLVERKLCIGTTAEELADKDSTYYLAFLSLYKNKECDAPIFEKWDDFEGLDEKEMEFYLSSIDEVLTRLKDTNIRKISVLPFFLNAFSYCKENISLFLGKPICRLTNYQLNLFSLGVRNLNILSQSEGSPPEYFEGTSIANIILWYDQNFSIILSKRKEPQQGQT